jgi:Pretoxin HINT domain
MTSAVIFALSFAAWVVVSWTSLRVGDRDPAGHADQRHSAATWVCRLLLRSAILLGLLVTCNAANAVASVDLGRDPPHSVHAEGRSCDREICPLHDRRRARLLAMFAFELYSYDSTSASTTASEFVATKAIPCASFRADTLVLMADGSKKPIGEIEVGDKVIATDPVTGKTSVREVTRLFTHIDDDLIDLVVLTDIGVETIHTTDHHRFWNDTTKAWVEAKDLKSGERLLTSDGDVVTVGDLNRVPGSAPMLDLTVDTDHTFYVALTTTAVLVHNQTCPVVQFADDLAKWRGTNMTEAESFAYHYGKHGGGVSQATYAADARAWADSVNLSGATKVTLADGSTGFRIRTPGGGPGGIVDSARRLITFWYN